MKKMIAGIFLFVLIGCADIRVPLGYTGAQLQAVKRDVRTCGAITTLEREQISFNLDRAIAWNAAALEHKGAPPEPIVIPEDASDYQSIIREDRVMEEYRVDVQQEKMLMNAMSGWLGKLGVATAGGGGILALLASLFKNLQQKKVVEQKDKAIIEYNDAIEELPQQKRIALGKARPAMSAAHDELMV